MVTINQLVDIVAKIANKKITKNHIKGPEGVRGRNSENTLIEKELSWAPTNSLKRGLESTYPWILSQIKKQTLWKLKKNIEIDLGYFNLSNSDIVG